MKKYYTRACNFYYGDISKKLIKQKKTLPLNGNYEISFDQIEILTRGHAKKIYIKDIKKLSKTITRKISKDIELIIKKKKNFSNFNFKNTPNIMGVLNLTPDSFSDGGKFNKKILAQKRIFHLYKSGSSIIDVGGESTRPGAKEIKKKNEWNRIKSIITNYGKKIPLSIDSRKSEIMEKSIKCGIKLINDISGLSHDKETVNVLKKHNIPFVIHHIQGSPLTMQVNPKYKNVLLDVYDYFEEKIKYLKEIGIKHSNIILDPGIGFGKNLKHNMSLITNISIFHSLGFPILLGMSRKKFIKDISRKKDSKTRLGGTISSSLFAMMQGVQILRVHDVKEVVQSIEVFKKLIK
jgi:dihydropteroate synthase|tara:strand:+ start:4190 stop:5239 length:1050 start_codon:yes stop_codon:yes gene_type:complete